MDVAYHLNFGAYTSMTLQYSPPTDVPEAEDLVGWLGSESQRVAGLRMLMGLLHAVALVVIPLVALVFSANLRRAALSSHLLQALRFSSFLTLVIVGDPVPNHRVVELAGSYPTRKGGFRLHRRIPGG